MGITNLSVIEKKVLGAMLLLADQQLMVRASHLKIAEKMGYARNGGSISSALRILEMNNYITRLEKGEYQILL